MSKACEFSLLESFSEALALAASSAHWLRASSADRSAFHAEVPLAQSLRKDFSCR
ncbi:MAG: hypothetical protein ACOY0T_38105 [Myxococcota bacterium]